MKKSLPSACLRKARLRDIIVTVAVAWSLPLEAQAQTFQTWRGENTQGNLLNGTAWWNFPNESTMVFGQQEFDNNVFTTMTNNNGGTAFSTWRWLFKGGASSARTITGDGLRFFDSSGADPQIINQSSATHVLNVAVSGDGSSGDPFQIWLDSTGGLTFGSTVNNQGSDIQIQGTAGGAKTVTFSGVVSGSGGMFINNANATALFDAANTYTGQLTINAGTARLNNSGDSFGASTQAIRIGTGATLDLNGVSTTVGSVAEEGSGDSGSINLGAGTLTVTADNLTAFQGNISGTGGLTKQGSHTLNLFGTQSYTGATAVSGGLLSSGVALSTSGVNVSGTGTFQTTAANILSDSASVTISAGTYALGGSDTVGSFSMSGGSLNGSATLTAATYALQGGTVAANLGNGTATASSGTTALNGTLAGNLTVDGGTVNLGSANRLASGSTLSIGSGQLNLGGNESVAGLSGNGGTLGLGTHTFTATIASGADSFGGTVSGSGNLTKTGGGTLTLSGNNTFGGVLTVADGKLTVSTINNASQDGVLGNSANAVVLGANGQTGFLHYVGNTNASTDKMFTAATGGTAGIEASNAATTLTLSGVIGGAGNVQKGGAGTLRLEGTNTFTGALNVHDGTLEIGSINNNSTNGTLGNSTHAVALGKSGSANVATLLYTGATASTTKGFSMASDATAGVINVANAGTTLTVSGQITGSSGSGLTKTGIGRLSLSASSSYNGPTTVTAGDLNLSGGSIASSSVSVSSGASLSGYGSVGTIGGAGTINPGNSPGIITAPQVNPSAGTDFNFEFTGLAPAFNNAASSVNDLIRITSGTPFSQSLNAGNIINVYFSGDALYTGGAAKQIKGGFFTDSSSSFLSSINGGAFQYFFAMSGGSVNYEGISYGTLAQYQQEFGSTLTITISTVGQSASFDGVNTIDGQILQLEVIPEPSTYALLTLSAIALGAYQWRRRRRL